MAISVRLDDDFVDEVKIHSKVASRSVPKQIEHWARIGKIAEENPDLPYEFIQEAMLAQEEIRAGKVTRYERRSRKRN